MDAGHMGVGSISVQNGRGPSPFPCGLADAAPGAAFNARGNVHNGRRLLCTRRASLVDRSVGVRTILETIGILP